MKKSYLYLVAAMAVASCANNDELAGTADSGLDNGTTAIAFNMDVPAVTRAESNAGAAKSLNYEFIVWGEKNETDKTATDKANLVFENYRVQYVTNSGTSSVTNTNGWEYVGIAPYSSGVTPKITAATQTIKYWDLGKQYTFTAVSAKGQDITDGKVVITKKEGDTNTDKIAKGYTIELKNGASAANIYLADRKEVTTNSSTEVKAVQMQFRNFQTNIRFGFYETVQGYKVQITGVKYNNKTTAESSKFGVDGQFVTVPSSEGSTLTYKVTYDSNNVPVVETSTTGTLSTASYQEFGSNPFSKDLGTTSTAAVYDQDNGAYTAILPNPGNTTAMSFTVSYKLISEDTGEEIAVTDRKVTVPAAYCQWKPNFAYTYLFKISDSSTGLYPITFDAVVVDSQTGNQETITEVGEPSITTIGFNDKAVVTGKDEYEDGNTIYATVNETSGMTSSNTVLYTVTASAGSGDGKVAPSITEASVKNCIANGTNNTTDNTWTATDATGGKLVATKVTTSNDSFVSEVPNEDGNGNRSISALKWTASGSTSAETYYAVEYSKTDNSTTTKYYKIVKVAKKSSN